MHENEFRDHTIGTLFSTEQQNRGTMLHEAGHALFGLADEYRGGGHWEAQILPNNWRNRKDARNDAPQRHKQPQDVKRVQRDVFKICDNNGQMNNSGVTITGYDLPCRDRVKFTIEVNAGIP